jgi:1,4-dihydroxy-2-naphthoyl-CoA hydrolase
MTLLDRINANPLPFATLMGVEFTHAELDKVVARLTVRLDLCTAGSIVHGGALMAFIDTVGAMATVINLPAEAKGTTTIESKTNFLAGAPVGSVLTATSTPIHRGRRTQVWQTRIELEGGRLVATAMQTQMVL